MENLHSFVVRDLASSFFICYIVLIEEMYDKWTNVVTITRVVYKTVCLVTALYIASYSEEGVLKLGMNSVSTL